jgi:hypothetical protein
MSYDANWAKSFICLRKFLTNFLSAWADWVDVWSRVGKKFSYIHVICGFFRGLTQTGVEVDLWFSWKDVSLSFCSKRHYEKPCQSLQKPYFFDVLSVSWVNMLNDGFMIMRYCEESQVALIDQKHAYDVTRFVTCHLRVKWKFERI